MTDNSVKTEYSVALGFFDGLHRAHFSVLESALINARRTGLTPAVLLFDEHPRTALTGETVPALLTREERDERLIKMGFTLLFVSFKDYIISTFCEFTYFFLCLFNLSKNIAFTFFKSDINIFCASYKCRNNL